MFTYIDYLVCKIKKFKRLEVNGQQLPYVLIHSQIQ